jgi:NADH-quinone oxidoreductase subunit J
MVETALFVIFGIAAVGGALVMVWARNPVYSAMGLMVTMFSLAVFYVSNSAHFVAAVQVIVYAGAVMTLFLFVIMLIGVDKAEDRTESLRLQRPLSALLLALFVAGVLVAGREAWTFARPASGEAANGTIENIGDLLFRRWLLPFEVTALLLIIAAAGAVALAYFRDAQDQEAET